MTLPIRLRLYLAGRTVSAERARVTIKELEQTMVAKFGQGAIVTEIIDALAVPEAAARDQVFATPTLIRISPGPARRLFGDLSSVDKIVAALNLDVIASALPPVLQPLDRGPVVVGVA